MAPLGSTQSDEFVSVHKIVPSDIPFCTPIFVDAYQETYAEPWSLQTGDARLCELYQAAPDYCFALRVDGTIAGFILARPFSWHDGTRVWIEEVIVKETHRGRGLGALLLRTLFEECRRRSVVGVSLISQRGSLAFKMYKRMGWRSSEWMHLEADLRDLP